MRLRADGVVAVTRRLDRPAAAAPAAWRSSPPCGAGLIAGEQLRRRAPTGLVLEIEIAERLPGGVLHDEPRIIMLLDDPRRREAAKGQSLLRLRCRLWLWLPSALRGYS